MEIFKFFSLYIFDSTILSIYYYSYEYCKMSSHLKDSYVELNDLFI